MVDTKKIALGVGAGIVAAGAAAAGYYFYGSKDAKKNRRIAAKWASDMKAEILREARAVKNLDRGRILGIVDRVARTYSDVRAIDSRDVRRAVDELREHWEDLLRQATARVGRLAKSSRTSRARSERKRAATASNSKKS